MNKIINKFLLTGDKFMPKLHLRQPELLIVLVVVIVKFKNLEKQVILSISIRTN